MKVTITKVRRMRHALGWAEGLNERGHEVQFILPWYRLKGIADDVAHGELVTVTPPAHSVVNVLNPRMRRTA